MVSATGPDMLNFHVKCSQRLPSANAFFLVPMVAECRAQFASTWRDDCPPEINCPRGGNKALLPWTDPDCAGTWWSSRTPTVLWWYHCVGQYTKNSFWEKEENSSNLFKQNRVKGPAQEIEIFRRFSWHPVYPMLDWTSSGVNVPSKGHPLHILCFPLHIVQPMLHGVNESHWSHNEFK